MTIFPPPTGTIAANGVAEVMAAIIARVAANRGCEDGVIAGLLEDDWTLLDGVKTLFDGARTLFDGVMALFGGVMSDNTFVLDGVRIGSENVATLLDGVRTLFDGVATLFNGVMTLFDGVATLFSENVNELLLISIGNVGVELFDLLSGVRFASGTLLALA